MTEYVPRNGLSMFRISDDRIDPITGRRAAEGVGDQRADQRALGAARGWNIVREIEENDTGAYKKRRVVLPDGSVQWRVWRPDLREALRLLSEKICDGLIVTDLDRYGRDPYDLEDLIDIVERTVPGRRIPVLSLTGSLELETDAGVTMARVLMALANKSSRDTGRRVSRARLRQAEAGKWGGGRQPYGFEKDGVTPIAAEYALMETASKLLLEEVPISSIVRDLRANDIPSPAHSKGPWTTSALRNILIRPRNAGFMVSNKKILPNPAPWPAVVPPDVWQAVVDKLTDPARNFSTGPAPSSLGSSVYLCGTCDEQVRNSPPASPGRSRAYTCYHFHIRRVMPPVDAMVVDATVAVMSRPDVSDILRVPDEKPAVSVDMLRTEIAALRARKVAAANAFADSDNPEDGALLAATLRRINTRLSAALSALGSQTSRSPLSPLIGVDDVRAAWDGLSLGSQRAIIRELWVVRIMPVGRGCRVFDPAGVRIEPRP